MEKASSAAPHENVAANKPRNLYVIRRHGASTGDYNNYAAHGNMGGMVGAIGYGSLIDARLFLSEEEAQTFINTKLPIWGRSSHYPVRVERRDVGLTMHRIHALLDFLEDGKAISEELMEPARGRLLIWRK